MRCLSLGLLFGIQHKSILIKVRLKIEFLICTQVKIFETYMIKVEQKLPSTFFISWLSQIYGVTDLVTHNRL